MSCFFCEYYKELNTTCKYQITVYTGSESFDCKYYKVNEDYLCVDKRL